MKNYGVIECDPLLLTGLDGTVSYDFYLLLNYLFDTLAV